MGIMVYLLLRVMQIYIINRSLWGFGSVEFVLKGLVCIRFYRRASS